MRELSLVQAFFEGREGPVPIRESSIYEAKIINLFLPYLRDDVSDYAWQTLSKNLEIVIKKIGVNYG